jgi:hypothetical protein
MWSPCRRRGAPARPQRSERAGRSSGATAVAALILQPSLTNPLWLSRASTWKNARLIHLPVHASWLNQIELYFSIVQRKALTPNDFDSLEAFSERLLRFGDHHRHIAQPFDWTFIRADLDRLLARIDAHAADLKLAA